MLILKMNAESENECMDTTEEVEDENTENKPPKRIVYLPGQKLDENEMLEHDPSAYVMLHEADAGNYIVLYF